MDEALFKCSLTMQKRWLIVLGWRGRNERTGLEGIFPRSYVTVIDEKRPMMPAPTHSNDYGNMPLTVAGQSSDPHQRSKLEQNGVKFGKKLGNAVSHDFFQHFVAVPCF